MHLKAYPYIVLSLCFVSSLFLQGNENGEEEFYILPDFVVTDDDDKGYYSANTLAGTRTNELTKNIPMTISTVNAEMIEDFKMKTLEDLGNFVPSIEAEGNVYNNQEIRFRGLLTKNQLYEFMPRYSPLDWYNVGRSDIIRGANSLIYGQADPGGKVNVISKTANLNKDKASVAIEIGDKDWHKFSYDVNSVLGDNTAARFMFVDKHREFDANYKYQSFTGGTLELMHNISPKTRLRLHLETGVSERSLIGGTFKVGSSPTGLPNGIVADPKLADLISDEFLQEIINYSNVNQFDGQNYDSIYADPEGELNGIYGFIDVNNDNRVERNYTDWNGNGRYDTSDVWVIDAQADGSSAATNGNGIWDPGETNYVLAPGDGIIDRGSEPIENSLGVDADINQDGIYNDSDYAYGGLMTRSNNPNIWGITPSGGPLVPDYIDSREDIRNLFRGIDYSNSGTGFGPDSYSRKSFDYVLADLEHSFSDNFSVKVALAFEDLVDNQLSSGWSANQLNFSSGYGTTVRFPTLRSLNEYNANPINEGIQSPYESVLVDLTNANYAHLILDTIETKGIETIRADLKTAVAANWTGNVNLQAFGDVNADSNNDNAITNDEMIDYFVDNFLDISDAETQLEKFYELGKFGGRVQDFLKQSHPNYGSDYGYAWGNVPSGGGQALGDIFYNVLTDGEQSAPAGKAISELFNLDRFVDVSTYRTQLQDYATPEDFAEKEARTGELYETLDFENSFYNNFIDNPIPIDPENGIFFDITSEDFALTEDGEKLIYDSIPTWLIAGLNGQIRDMNTLPGVEISGLATNVFDNKVDGNDPDEVELQKRAIAKKVYDILVNEVGDPDSDNEFWDATSKIADFFKYELHESLDYSWMWKDYIQPGLILKLDAVLEDEDYLDEESKFVDIDDDGVRDAAMPSISSSAVEMLEPFIKRQWKKSSNKDTNQSARITFNYNEEMDFIPGKQQFLFGIDLDHREASRSEEQQVSLFARAWGDAENLYLRDDILSDYVLLYNVMNGTEGDSAYFNAIIEGQELSGAPNLITNTKIPLGVSNVAEWQKVYQADATVDSQGLWFAASGSYLNGKLRTLIGVRRDSIETQSEYSRFTLRAVDNTKEDLGANLEIKSQKYDETIYSPSIGGLYWFTQNLAIFGNYSESVISPNGFQFDVFGDITPPETGKGKEIGFKMSTPDNVLNGQLTVFSIDKKNEQRQNISWPMLTSLYPAKNANGSIRTEAYDNGYLPSEIYDFYYYVDRFGNPQTAKVDGEDVELIRAVFNPKGFRVADEEVRSEGLELDLYYNPTPNLSLFLGYAYLETTVLKSALDALEGLPTAGTSDHNINFTLKYNFKQGRLKGTSIGMNQKYRSAALLSHYFTDQDGDSQADYIPVAVDDPQSSGSEQIILEPTFNTLWLEDQLKTDIFVKWSGKLKKHHPWTVLQLNVNNIFNSRDLISTGLNNARYTEGRNIVLSAGFYF